MSRCSGRSVVDPNMRSFRQCTLKEGHAGFCIVEDDETYPTEEEIENMRGRPPICMTAGCTLLRNHHGSCVIDERCKLDDTSKLQAIARIIDETERECRESDCQAPEDIRYIKANAYARIQGVINYGGVQGATPPQNAVSGQPQQTPDPIRAMATGDVTEKELEDIQRISQSFPLHVIIQAAMSKASRIGMKLRMTLSRPSRRKKTTAKKRS